MGRLEHFTNEATIDDCNQRLKISLQKQAGMF